jgi:hypothetical protein
MPPRKTKVSKEQLVQETPVVFFLKINLDEQEIEPAEEQISYSDILNAVDNIEKKERFNTDLLKSILEKTSSDKYSCQTGCFWCCHPFSWTAIILPISYDAYKNIYTCQGNYCSPECALADNYANNKISESTMWNRHALLNHMYSCLYQDKVLSPAPPKSLLRLFGGPLDIEQYRDYLSGTNDIVLSDFPPIRLQFPSMNVQGPLRDIKKHVSLTNETIEKASAQLRLRRTKISSVTIPTLDMCIRRT